ncbi:hypothetical protein VPH184E373B_0159 [Vibrio phage 184E37-3b]|nr:hypothetical protein MYOV056v2_p0138 [Vibrio phage 184E37.3a]QZI89916.1 hypothetical protein MYOV057v1_p0001 [Vibrio phage 184E37.1]
MIIYVYLKCYMGEVNKMRNVVSDSENCLTTYAIALRSEYISNNILKQ